MVTRIEIGTNVISGNFPLQDGFQRDDPLRRNTLSVEPHRNVRLANTLAGKVRELFSHHDLPTSITDRLSKPREHMSCHMEGNHTTVGVIGVNTRSSIGIGQTAGMARTGDISDFWRRFTAARAAYKSDLPTRQEDVAKEWGVRQSAVTKWKTGKSHPDPGVLRGISNKYNVCYEWLDSGRGPMRPLKALDPIVNQVIDAMDALSPDGKVEVLKAALTQQALQIPSLAAQVKQAQRTAEQLSKPKPSKAG